MTEATRTAKGLEMGLLFMALCAFIVLGGYFAGIPRNVRSAFFTLELLTYVAVVVVSRPFHTRRRSPRPLHVLLEMSVIAAIVWALIAYNVTNQHIYSWVFHIFVQVGMFCSLLRQRGNLKEVTS